MSIIVIGIDLAKSIFAVHGVNQNGKAELVKPRVSREQLLPLIAQLPPCLIGMEACSGAHHWARLFRQHGHSVKLIAPKFVTPYRMSGKRGKNDAADAPPSAKPSPGPPCALSPSRKNTSRSSCACIVHGKALLKSAPPPITDCAACSPNSASSCRRSHLPASEHWPAP
jgi:hypothetical protein